MSKRPGKASFQTQGRLLQELGERLVARADVALTELIKNAYDADANECEIKLNQDSLVIRDDGHGMTEKEFLGKWMEIATPDKQRNRLSRRYKRTVTGSKGIGRFAARFLGLVLKVETTAKVKGGKKETLTVTFDWQKIDIQPEIQKVKIPYTVEPVDPKAKTGTTLTILDLRNPNSSTVTKELRTNLLSIANPYTGLEKRQFDQKGGADSDPGFAILLPSDDKSGETDLAAEILKNAFSRLTIERKKTSTRFVITDQNGKELLNESLKGRSMISQGFFADIRYFPKRKGMFKDKGVDGRTAWAWIGDKENNGIGIVDHGFRIRPFGFGEDDWLQLSYDAAHRSRKWRSPFTSSVFEMPKKASSDAKLNPMLYLPGFHQLVGAVFVESAAPTDSSKAPTDLTSSMDREGFVENAGFEELRNLIRAGLEMLAFVDHREQRKLEKKKRRDATRELRSELKSAVEFIEAVPGLAKEDRNAVVDRFQQLSEELDDAQEYYRVGTYKLEMMGLLGVMAGFVTHEMQRIMYELNNLLTKTKRLEKKDSSIKKIRASIEDSLATVSGQLSYSTTFIGAVHESQSKPSGFKALGAATLITKQFAAFRLKRNIELDIDIERSVMAPAIPKALYHGVLMNLFTNALKAAVGGESASSAPAVVIKSWNEKGQHILEVADNGIGIPPSIQKRIWDPLFTTTSASDFNPLGSGMGLGLTLVKRLVNEVDGKISLVSPPPGYSTCFKVVFPTKKG